MFENGNYRRRKRMKRPFRTTPGNFSKMFNSTYLANTANFPAMPMFSQHHHHHPYQTYSRYESG